MPVQENAAAVHIQLTSEEKAYLEEIFNPEKVSESILSGNHRSTLERCFTSIQ